MQTPLPQDGVDRGFLSNNTFWIIASARFGEVSLLKGLRYPGEWAATQAQIDYSQGFTKRGLFGAVVTPLFGLNHYVRFAFVSEVLLVALFALIAVYVYRSGLLHRVGGGAPAAVFFASYAVTYLAHIVGYLDIPLACLTTGVLLVRNHRTRFALAVPAIVVALLMHEMFLLVFLPLILLRFLLQGFIAGTDRERRRNWLRAAVLLVIAVATCVFVALRPSLDGVAVAKLQSRVAGNVDFRPDANVFRVLVLSLDDNLQMMRTYFVDPAWWHDQAVSAMVFLPTVGALLWCAWRVLSAARRPHRIQATALVALCSFAPVWMHLIGYDVGRWNALIVLDSFLALLVAASSTDDVVALPPAAGYAMILILGLSLASGGLLMGEVPVRLYPFF